MPNIPSKDKLDSLGRERKCSHAKAQAYLQNVVPNCYFRYSFQVKCNRCKKWIGDKIKDYQLPKDFKGVAEIVIIKPK